MLAENVEMASLEKLEVRFEPKCGSRSDVNLHHPQTTTAGDTSGPRTAKYFLVFFEQLPYLTPGEGGG